MLLSNFSLVLILKPEMFLRFSSILWLPLLAYVFFFGLIIGLIGGLADKVKADKGSPNQGIKLSRKNSLAVFLVTVALTVGLVLSLNPGQIVGVSGGFCLIVGLIAGLNRGGSAVIKHYALRLTLWMSRCTPLNFIKFLDHCAKLILLKKVGGGYIFIHRMLLDYFAELTRESVGVGDTTKSLK